MAWPEWEGLHGSENCMEAGCGGANSDQSKRSVQDVKLVAGESGGTAGERDTRTRQRIHARGARHVPRKRLDGRRCCEYVWEPGFRSSGNMEDGIGKLCSKRGNAVKSSGRGAKSIREARWQSGIECALVLCVPRRVCRRRIHMSSP